MQIFTHTNYDFLGKKWIFIGLSLVLTAVALGSWATKGLKYGIDFTGGTNVNVRFVQEPPVDQIRKAIATKVSGDFAVQQVANQPEVIISLPLKNEQQQMADRQMVIDTLNTAFNQNNPKLDFNGASQTSLADRLRDPLARAGAQLNEEQLQNVVRAILEFRNTPPRSGVIKSFDELRGVEGVTDKVIQGLKDETFPGAFAIRGVEQIGPKIGKELRDKAVLAVLYALGGMLVYLALRFEWVYGVAAVVAVFHDTLITVGLFSLFDKEISLNVVAALLTLVGYSMNDTIVVFDRIREKLRLSRKAGLAATINESINETLSRTVLTSGLTFVACVALLLFGGPVLNGFSFALVVGIIVGTYSSIFIASPILLAWQQYVEKRGGKVSSAPAAAAASREPVKKK